MYSRNYNDCEKCNNCINEPDKDICNIFCHDKNKNCYESYKLFNPPVYGKAYVKLQPYENLFNIDDAFNAGTIFKDLYNPYCDSKHIKGGK